MGTKNFKDGEFFEDGFTRLVYLSIHSYLIDACILRDYLAEFIINYIIKWDHKGFIVSTMAGLKKHILDKNSYEDSFLEQVKLDIETGDIEAVEELLKFCPIKNLEAYLPEEPLADLTDEEVDTLYEAFTTGEAEIITQEEPDSGLYEASGLKEVFETPVEPKEIEETTEDDDFWD